MPQSGLAFTCMRALRPCNGLVPCLPRPRLSTRLPCWQLAHRAWRTRHRGMQNSDIARHRWIWTLPVCLQHGASLCIFKGLLEFALQTSTGGARLEPVSSLAMLFHLSCQTAASRKKHGRSLTCIPLTCVPQRESDDNPALQQAYPSMPSRLSPITATLGYSPEVISAPARSAC